MPYAGGQIGVESSGNRSRPLWNLRTTPLWSYIYWYLHKLQLFLTTDVSVKNLFTEQSFSIKPVRQPKVEQQAQITCQGNHGNWNFKSQKHRSTSFCFRFLLYLQLSQNQLYIIPWVVVPHLAGGSTGHDPLWFDGPVAPGFQMWGLSFDAPVL